MMLLICISFRKAWEAQINQDIRHTIQPLLPWKCVAYKLCSSLLSKGVPNIANPRKVWRHSVLKNISAEKRDFSVVLRYLSFKKQRLYVSWKGWYHVRPVEMLFVVIAYHLAPFRRILRKNSPRHYRLFTIIPVFVCNWNRFEVKSHNSIESVFLCCSLDISCAKMINCFQQQ